MRMKGTTLSSIRRVAITLLVMLLTTASAWAQFFPQTKYYLYLNENYQGGGIGTVEVDISEPTTTYTLASYDEPNREGYMFYGWSTSSTGEVLYRTNDQITLTGNLTLYAIWGNLKYTITDEEKNQVELSGYEGYKPEGTLNIPATVTINGTEYSVTSIGNSVFSDCTSLQSVTIPNSVTSIGDNAFEYCTSLQSVTIPNSVTNIGEQAFSGCVSLQSVTIPESVTSIGSGAFYGCSQIKSVTIPNSVTSIGNNAFEHCVSLESVTIPNSVTSIGNNAFEHFVSLESVTIPESVTSIGHFAFPDCSNLTSITINGNPFIGICAFENTPATVTMNLTASQIGNDYWTTFYNDSYNFQADENTTVYKATVNGSSLMLTEVEDRIVNRRTAVILKSSGNPVMTLTESGSEDTNSNDLRGISYRTKRTSVISNFSANEIYTMGNTSAGFGFHRYTGEYVPAGEAFLPLYIDDEATAQSITLVSPSVSSTGIKPVSSDKDLQKHWFTISGARLGGKPSHPGVYINGNKKVMIK